MTIAQKLLWTGVVVLVGAVIFGVLRDTTGRGQYFATGVEVLILFYIWTRKVPISDSKTDDEQGVGKARPLRGSRGQVGENAMHRQSRPNPASRPKNASATGASETEADLSDWKERYGAAFIAIEYRPDATEAWNELKLLPKKHREKFLEKLNTEPQGDIAAIKSTIRSEHQKEIAPFDDDQMNEALTEVRKLGKTAEKEFLSVHETLGKLVTADHLIKLIREKYQIKKIWGSSIFERGLIGGREYYITDSDEIFVKDPLGNFRCYKTIDEARWVLNIPSSEDKIPE